MIPAARTLRVVGDVHGDARAFAFAVDTDHFVIQLGDLTDGGPDSAGVLRLVHRLVEQGRGLFLLGNHDRKLARALAGHPVHLDAALAATIAQLDPELRERTLYFAERAPAWIRQGDRFFVHGGFHTGMLDQDPPPGLGRVDHLLSRALFGETTGRVRPDGYPERRIGWVERIPAGLTVYCGHDQRSTDGRPWARRNAAGGAAVFVDTGAGKGGHLSWIDLPPAAGRGVARPAPKLRPAERLAALPAALPVPPAPRPAPPGRG